MQLHISARAYHAILNLTCTLAELAGREGIETAHPSALLGAGLAEAMQYWPSQQS